MPEAAFAKRPEGYLFIITAICPRVGYSVAADIAKTAIRTGASVKDVLISRNLLTEEEINKLLDPYAMT